MTFHLRIRKGILHFGGEAEVLVGSFFLTSFKRGDSNVTMLSKCRGPEHREFIFSLTNNNEVLRGQEN